MKIAKILALVAALIFGAAPAFAQIKNDQPVNGTAAGTPPIISMSGATATGGDVSFTANSQSIVLDTLGFGGLSLTVTGTFSQTLAVQWSNKSSTGFTAGKVRDINSGVQALTITAVGNYMVPVGGRYAKITTTGFVSGTAVVTPILKGVGLASSAQSIIFPLAGDCGTVALSTPCFDVSQAWSGTATFTLDKANVSADPGPSNAASLLIDRQYLGVSKFSVTRAGVAVFASSVQSGGTVSSSAGGGASIGADGSGKPQVVFGSGGSVLNGEAANTLAQRNGVSGQTFNVYNTYTDASNYERGFVSWSSNNLIIGTEKLGTGTARRMKFYTDGTSRWVVENTGMLLAETDNTYDIGASGANRPRDIFNGRDHILGRHLSSTGTAPAVTSCGTSPTILGSDLAGEVTTGTATPTACTITFNVAYAAQPYCTVIDRTALANLTSYTVSTTAIVLTTTAASSQKVVYHCIGA